MTTAIDPIGASAAYGTAPRSTRANQAEEKEQIDLIKRLEEDEQEHGHQDGQRQKEQNAQGEPDKPRRDEVLLQSVSPTPVNVADDTTHDEPASGPVIPSPTHIDMKA